MLRTMLFSVFMLVSFSANAVLITGNTIRPYGVGYTSFSIDTESSVTIEILNGLFYPELVMFDPELVLFHDDGLLDVTDYIDRDDDSGTVALKFQNALLTLYLPAGDYIIAVGDYKLDTAEAISGTNDMSQSGANTYDLRITATNANATVTVTTVGTSVPEPSAIALMGLGLLGFGATRRKLKKH
ncbi:MAG: PEP-CTERM sorting domain-containing protein [Gammaproteobacteria bacterium]|nr:PEP-CTERM sorting domain-containing protein [Gammaproteobacteria bacterium]